MAKCLYAHAVCSCCIHMPYAHALCICRVHMPYAHAVSTCHMQMPYAHAICICHMRRLNIQMFIHLKALHYFNAPNGAHINVTVFIYVVFRQLRICQSITDWTENDWCIPFVYNINMFILLEMFILLQSMGNDSNRVLDSISKVHITSGHVWMFPKIASKLFLFWPFKFTYWSTKYNFTFKV